MSPKGELVGIDFLEHVVIVITPSIDKDTLTWQCFGSPTEALPKACHSL